MVSKRSSLAFPEQERRGRKAILRTSEEVAADERTLESQSAGLPELQNSGTPERGHPPLLRADGKPDRAAYPKATYRISPVAIEAIEDARRTLRRQYGIKATLEEIAEVAILATCQELGNDQISSILVRQLSGVQERQTSR